MAADGGTAGRHHCGKLAALEEENPLGEAIAARNPLAHVGGITSYIAWSRPDL